MPAANLRPAESSAAANLLPATATPLWLWPNLLSLDAPLVALVWQELFAHAVGFELSWAERLVLAISIWLVYAADRWMDAVRGPAPHTARHRFAWRIRAVLPPLWMAVLVGDFVIAFSVLQREQLAAGLAVMLLSLVYFGLVHWATRHGGLPALKEAAVGFLFAAGVLFAFVRGGGETMLLLAGPGLSLALVACANCLAIESWEKSRPLGGRWGLALLLGALAVPLVTFSMPWSETIVFALLTAAVGLTWLDRKRAVLPTNVLRVGADAALLAGPAALLLFS